MPKRQLQGTVVSDVNEKTVVVRVDRAFTHPVMKKTVRRSKKYHAHDEANAAKVGEAEYFVIATDDPETNIKTAEALYSGKYVIGSEAAFRGFQPFIELPEVTVARSPADFQQAMRRVLQSPPLRSTPVAAEDLRHTLRWDQCLAPVPEAVTKIIQRGH